MRIIATTDSCGTCPNYMYYSGGVYRCGLVDENVLDKSKVAPYCPLPLYPAKQIAEMETTILGLREGDARGFYLVLLTFIARKLKLNLSTNAFGISIPYDNGKSVYLGLDCVKEIRPSPLEITFLGSTGAIFKLSPEWNPPLLREATDESGDTWHHHELR
jgi:hypothetical protein